MKRLIILFTLLLVVLCGCTTNKEEYIENKPNNSINTQNNQSEKSSGEAMTEKVEEEQTLIENEPISR